MGHITALVIGNDPAAQLRPYDGELSQEERDKYIKIETADVPDGYRKWYNPNARWDYWVHFEDSTPRAKSEYDFAADRDVAKQRMSALWDKVEPHLVGHEWEPFISVHGRLYDKEKHNIDDVCAFYFHQEGLRHVRRACALFDGFDFDQFMMLSRQEAVYRARCEAIKCYAMIKDGLWLEGADRKMLGSYIDCTTEHEWFVFVGETIDSLPDNTVLSFADCHI